MTISRNKTIATAITTILVLSMTLTLFAIPSVNAAWDNATSTAVAAGMKWDFPNAANYNASTTRLLFWNRWKDHVPTYVFISATPNPVGVGQEMTFILFNPQLPNNPSSDRWHYTVDIVQPDNTKVTLPPTGASGIYNQPVENGQFVSDTTGAAWTTWTPSQVGNHTVTITFYAVEHTAYASTTDRNFYGVTYDKSTYTKNFIVQNEAVHPTGISVYPLPTEYWTRPIEGQNNAWYQVALKLAK